MIRERFYSKSASAVCEDRSLTVRVKEREDFSAIRSEVSLSGKRLLPYPRIVFRWMAYSLLRTTP